MSRKTRDYPKEIEEAARRIKKKNPEILKSTGSSRDWFDFLDNLGVHPNTTQSEAGKDFWESVREKITENEIGVTNRQLAEANVEVVKGIYRDAKGRFTKEVTDKSVYSFRSKETGKFVSRKTIIS